MTLEDDEVVRPGPDDSVAPGVVLKLDALPAAQAAPAGGSQ